MRARLSSRDAIGRARWLASVAGLLAIVAATRAAYADDAAGTQLARGKLLVASDRLLDPSFAEAVVLLLEYQTGGGALGVIINRPTDVKVSTLLPRISELKGRSEKVHLGGPVSPSSLVVLVRAASPPQGTHQVVGDVCAISSIDVLRRMLGSKQAKGLHDVRFRAYVGYTGWAPGQLDFEVMRGDWQVLRGDGAMVFDRSPADIWPELNKRGEGHWVRDTGVPLG